MSHNHCPDNANRESGIQLVEFALVLPLLVMLFLAAGEGGAMVRTHQVLNNAAREGARLATAPTSFYIYRTGNPQKAIVRAAIVDEVRNYVQVNYSSVDIAQLSVTISDPAVNVANPATGGGFDTTVVTVSYPYRLRYLPSFGAIPATINLSASAQFQNLY